MRSPPRRWLILLTGALLLLGTVAAVERPPSRQGGPVETRGGPSAAEEAGEQQVAPVRKSIAPQPRRIARPRALPRRVPRVPPASQPHATTRDSHPVSTPVASGPEAPANRSERSPAPSQQPDDPSPQAEEPPRAEPPRESLLVPPVLLQAPAGYPGEGYHLVLERGGLAPQVRIDVREGRVVLRILVHADGSVGRVEIIEPSGEGALDRAAASTAWAWRFSPATRDGSPIDAWVLIPVRFVIR